MSIHPTSHRVLSRYLTPFYRFALGLTFILVLVSCSKQDSESQVTLPVTLPPPSASTTESTPIRTQEQANTATPLPDIPSTPDEKTPSPLGVSSEELRGLQVIFWHPWTGAIGAELNSLLAEFNQTNRWGFTVQPRTFESFGSLDDALEPALASETLPDVIINYGYQARHLDQYDALVDVTPYFDDPVWGYSMDEQADFYPEFWNEDVVNKGDAGETRRLGVPYFRSAYVLFYNQSWAYELGYSNPPVTQRDFRAIACAAAGDVTSQGDRTDQGKGGWLITPQPGALAGWIYAFGGEVYNPETGKYPLNTPETRQAFDFLKDLADSGCAWSDPEVDPRKEFSERKAIYMVGSLFDIPAQRAAFNQAGNPDEWIVIPFPSSRKAVVVTYGPSLMIMRSTPPKQLAAWLVIKWLLYPPNQTEWVETLRTYPTRRNTMSYLNEASGVSPQWAQALDLLPLAQGEPSAQSWGVMRWTFLDAMEALFDPQFEAEQIPALLENLDRLGSEIVMQER